MWELFGHSYRCVQVPKVQLLALGVHEMAVEFVCLPNTVHRFLPWYPLAAPFLSTFLPIFEYLLPRGVPSSYATLQRFQQLLCLSRKAVLFANKTGFHSALYLTHT